MPRVTIQLPRVLCDMASCAQQIEAAGETVADALADLVRREPRLALHLFDDSGALRRHVLCFHNETSARDRAELAHPLVEGDRLTIVNSVAGG